MTELPKPNRRGKSTVEFALICCMVIGVCLLGVFMFGKVVNGLLESANGVAILSGADSLSDSGDVNSPADAAASSPTIPATSGAEYFQTLMAGLGAIAILSVGFIYWYLVRSRQSADEKEACDVVLDNQYSDAIQRILQKRNRIHSDMRENWVRLFQGQATIGPYMSTQLETVRPDLAIEECADMLAAQGFRRFMVTDDEGRLKGVVSRKDIKSKTGETVADVMTDAPKTASPETSLRVALTILLQHRVSCLPIIEDEVLVGILSTSDLMIVLQCVLVLLDSAKNQQNKPQAKTNPVVPVATGNSTSIPNSPLGSI